MVFCLIDLEVVIGFLVAAYSSVNKVAAERQLKNDVNKDEFAVLQFCRAYPRENRACVLHEELEEERALLII